MLQLSAKGLTRMLVQHASKSTAVLVESLSAGPNLRGKSMLMLQVRMMCQCVNVLDVTVLPVYRPSTEEIHQPELFAANVRAVYAEDGGMRAAEQSQREFLALTRVGTNSLVRCCAQSELGRVASMHCPPHCVAAPLQHITIRRRATG